MWFYTSILTSVLMAISVIVDKRLIKNVSALVLTWATLVLATPIILIFAVKEGIPQLDNLFFIGIAGSVVFYTISQVAGFKAIRIADLSSIYPLVALGPVFTLFVAMVPPISEKPSTLAILGVFITLLGVYILNTVSVKEGILKQIKSLFKNKASFLMIASVLLNSIVIVFDKLAINSTIPRSTTFTLLVENIVVIFGLLPVLYLRSKHFSNQVFQNLKLFFLLGLLNAAATILAFLSAGHGDVGLVATLFKTNILLVLLFSYLVFKDRPRRRILIGSIIMIAGVILIRLGS